MMWKIQLFKLNFDHRERDAVLETVDSGWLTMGERILGFEAAFGDYLGHGARCTAVSNGTAALHMALLALDVGQGDEVIIPALTFVADANAVRMVGARPVLADCASRSDWNVSAESIARKITPRTKAVIVVHYAGFPCDMPAIAALCRERGLKLVEDVAHAPGASIAGQMCGTFGDVGCFSFFSNKNLSIGEGGMVVACDGNLSQRLRYLRSHGMTTLTLDRHKGRAATYDVAEPGLNYRMDEIRAAIGLVQLDKLPAGNLRRKELTERYRRNLAGSPLQMPFDNLSADVVSAYHILPVLLPQACDRMGVIEMLKTAGVQSSIHYLPFSGFTAYREYFTAQDAPLAEEICSRELTMPLYPTMSDREVDLVTGALLGAVA
ncbi:DegT/DnrJ/EryC1/StrS family aminotransferase [Polaromonas naphthalenivorans]|uniref:DegT/DnrJ/EryC1/StrS aminotransferase n=1 Tax=Polaromonas naphthalenivorans (strain CJ2) TaxID=365044 RepID=A1VRY8_POLNA|nr:DegT/DnrJ/EryC1/StrS family aminotransferase [Polaromonas naphthalenivorans]ABM38416.1 DegT/DnrJ/EryC1/StrS aminotransferase [Polaromonas naphthalenivorans CJ2]